MNGSYTQYDINTFWILGALIMAILIIASGIVLLVSGKLSDAIVKHIEKREDKKIFKVAERGRRDFT